MCYAPTGATPGWTRTEDGKLVTELQGARFAVDLSGSSTRIEVVATNTSGGPLVVRMGGEGTSSDLRIGELLQRPVEPEPGATGPDYLPYNSLQPVTVEDGWRTVFYLDAPLGRDPSYGQYFVFTVEAARPSGPAERRSLPLTAVNVGGESGGR